MKVWIRLFVYMGLGALASSARAQAPIERRPPSNEQTPTLQLSARLVTVAVNAVDSQGAPVGGLAQADFHLLEDNKEQKIAFFEKESATPLSIVLAIDGSQSLARNERLAKEAAKRFVQSLLRSQDELEVLEFADAVTEIVPFTSDKKRIEDGLGNLLPGDATAMYDAIFLASQQLGKTNPAGGRRRVLVLITDGGDTVHGTHYDQALEQAQRAGVMVYSLVIIPIYADAGRNTGGEHALIQMSSDTGGKYFYVEDKKDLAAAYAKVSDDLRTQYVLGYYAPAATPHNRRDGFRTLRVELTGSGVKDATTLRYRTGYYASK